MDREIKKHAYVEPGEIQCSISVVNAPKISNFVRGLNGCYTVSQTVSIPKALTVSCIQSSVPPTCICFAYLIPCVYVFFFLVTCSIRCPRITRAPARQTARSSIHLATEGKPSRSSLEKDESSRVGTSVCVYRWKVFVVRFFDSCMVFLSSRVVPCVCLVCPLCIPSKESSMMTEVGGW